MPAVARQVRVDRSAGAEPSRRRRLDRRPLPARSPRRHLRCDGRGSWAHALAVAVDLVGAPRWRTTPAPDRACLVVEAIRSPNDGPLDGTLPRRPRPSAAPGSPRRVRRAAESNASVRRLGDQITGALRRGGRAIGLGSPPRAVSDGRPAGPRRVVEVLPAAQAEDVPVTGEQRHGRCLLLDLPPSWPAHAA